MRTTRAGLRRIEQLIAEVSQTPMRTLIAEVANLIVSIEPPTPTLAANSFSRSEQQVMMVAVPRNHHKPLILRIDQGRLLFGIVSSRHCLEATWKH
jgi:hypothetical protein